MKTQGRFILITLGTCILAAAVSVGIALIYLRGFADGQRDSTSVPGTLVAPPIVSQEDSVYIRIEIQNAPADTVITFHLRPMWAADSTRKETMP